jgi:hypothetical protein
MTKDQILAEYGDELSSDAKAKLEDNQGKYDEGSYVVVKGMDGLVSRPMPTAGILGGLEIHPIRNTADYASVTNSATFTVYEVE